jgi:hypothetical protein|tara:strand:+ start:452 stop:622 length:171 start_codon:yes stop_codon:yes gene_type:complete
MYDRDKFSSVEILEAVGFILKKKINKKKVENKKDNKSLLPPNTEQIISQAEKYLKN